MEGEEGDGIRLSKRFSDKGGGSGEVDYKVKAGTAWSHSYLNQKPWHPLSYPNQRRKWIAEQTHAQRERHAEEIAREYAQEQEFFRQTALISKKEKEKVEMMKAVSFMYVRPPGYNAESAKAAEIADERKKQELDIANQSADGALTAMQLESLPSKETAVKEKTKPRPKDVFGRPLPTEEEFEILKNAPRMDTGVPARVKPFGVEVRNVKCLRCGNYGHQSGDRECPLKDAIMPNEESRLKRDDPLTAIMAQMDPSEPLKWELKQKPGMSPPRGGFQPDDPNQQIVAEDIFDEYGGFLSGGCIPELLTNFTSKPKERKSTKKSKHKKRSSDQLSSPSDDDEGKSKEKKHKKKKKKNKQNHYDSNSSEESEFDRHHRKSKRSYSSEDSHSDRERPQHRGKKSKEHSYSSEGSHSDRERPRHRGKRSREQHSYSSGDSDSDRQHKGRKSRQKHSYSLENESDVNHRKSKDKYSYSSEDSDTGRHSRKKRSQHKHSYDSEDSDAGRNDRKKSSRHEHSYDYQDSDSDRHGRSKKTKQNHSYSSLEVSDRHHKSQKSRHKHSYLRPFEDSGHDTDHRRKHHHHQQSRH